MKGMEASRRPPERRVARRLVLAAPILDVYEDEVEGPHGRARRVVVDHRGAVAVLPLLDADRAVLLRQWRYALGRELLEIPAGVLEPGEEPAAAARRELAEETGYRAGWLRPLVAVYPTPGFCTERIHLFVAGDLVPGPQAPERDEHLQPLVVTRQQVREWVAAGGVEDAKTLLALLWWLAAGAGPAQGGEGACAWW